LATPARDFALTDVHRDRGFSCVNCHGGDPAATDKAAAKAPSTGFRGKPTGAQVIAVCSRCHSDAALMRKYAPKQRVDQATEYASSVHGQQLAKGDHHVATCVSCHGAHGVRLVSDAQSPVYPLNVANTCTTCHADQNRMKGYTRGGAPLATDQKVKYESSVHHEAMVKRNDLSAPTCNDCHGNHGAAPPGVGAVSNVCGTCHAVFATKFATSAHSRIFDRACVECHGNHAVLMTSDAMIGTTKDTVCATCHEAADDAGFIAAGRMRTSLERLKASLAANDELIARARNAGMEVSDQELALAEVRTKLTQARTEIHGFDPAAVDAIVNDGMKGLAAIESAGHRALADLQYRRRGLFISLVAILLVVVGLSLKIRELNRRGHSIE
jgi:predicted CXXCH cytochrome family protein